MTNLFKSLSDYNNSLEKSKQSYSGLLGLITDGERRVQHPSRNGFVYVRLRDNLSEVLLAFNEKVSPVYDLPVIIERKNNLWYVVGRDIDRYQNWGTSAPFLPKHGAQHSFNRDENTGGDIVPIYPDQFMPLLVYPSGTLGSGNLIVAPYILQRDSDFIYVGNTGTGNVLGYKPTNNQAILGLVYLDTVSGNPGVLIGSGTPFSASITGSSQIYPYIPYPDSTDHEPLYAFRLVSGTSSLTWDNLYNVRQFIGGGSGGGALPSLDPARVVYTDPSTGDMKTSDELIFNETDDTLTTGNPDGSGDGDGSYLHGFGGDKTHMGVLSTFHNLVTYAGDNARASLVKLITSLGTKASPLAVTVGTLLGRIRFAGYDGDTRVVDSATSADVKAIATEDFDSSGHGTKVVISTTPNNSTTMQDAFEIDHDGQMRLHSYGSGTHTGTVAKSLGVDTSGKVIESSPARKSIQLTFTHGGNAGVPASATRYLGFEDMVSGLQTSVYNIALPVACDIKNLYINTNSTQPSSGNLVFTLLKNGADTSITITVPANATANQFTDLTHDVSLDAGDSITLRIVNNATSTSALIIRCVMQIDIPLIS